MRKAQTVKGVMITIVAPTVLLNSLRIRWQSLFDPGVVPAIERMHILPTTIRKLLRHTGARSLVRSSAIGYDGPVSGNLVEVLSELFLGYPDRMRQFLI
jgi:hypothetical protein